MRYRASSRTAAGTARAGGAAGRSITGCPSPTDPTSRSTTWTSAWSATVVEPVARVRLANLWFTEPGTARVGWITTAGVVAEFATPRAGVPFTGVVATFADDNVGGASDFAATINWGDGGNILLQIPHELADAISAATQVGSWRTRTG